MMRKILFKKILVIIDAIELYSIDLHDLPIRIYEELVDSFYAVKLPEIQHLVAFLVKRKLLKTAKNGIDLSPAATIYAKSNQNSGVEALSIFESFLLNDDIQQFFLRMIKNNACITKKECLQMIDEESFNIMQQTVLFEINHEHVHLHPKLLHGITNILKEYQGEQAPLVSCCLTALYTSTIVSHEDLKVDYKNTELEMNAYRYKDAILSIIPRRGIPHDRDETKALQAFYKDTLFHEFNHACPICGISIPHMLIASHIKPFRDCAHIYEAIDHNNGLLLCRNHDYLFDQGYFTFDDKGYIILSQALLQKEGLETSYTLKRNYKLSDDLLREERRRFLAYHRNRIFLDNK